MILKILREPLLHFIVLGAALFVLFNWTDDTSGRDDNRIVVTPGRIEHLVAGFERTWQRPPTREEVRGLIDGYVREEVYYREALSLGLDKDDTIVRRRMKQKLEFLTADAAEALEPTDEELRKYLEAHPDAFRIEPRAAFRHVYLNPERHGASVEEAATDLLGRLEAGDLPAEGFAALGDRLMLPKELPLSRRGEIERLFGRRFADGVLEIPTGRWTGPVESSYGQHLVYVRERNEARLPALDEVRDLVLREWLNDRRKELEDKFYESLRERYTVVVERPAPRGSSSADEVDSIADAQ